MLLGRFGVLLGLLEPCDDRMVAFFVFLTSFFSVSGSLRGSLGAVLEQDETLCASSLVPTCPLPFSPSTVCFHGFACFMIIINAHLSTVSNCDDADLSRPREIDLLPRLKGVTHGEACEHWVIGEH